jgi:DNA modification methylase
MEVKYKPNNIYNVDSYKAIKEIPDKSIDCIYTDVPYLYIGGGGGSSELAQSINKSSNELTKANIIAGFEYSILDDFVRVMKKVNIIIWFSKLQMQDILNYFMNLKDKEIYFEPLVWIKTNPIPATNNVWLRDLEYAFHFREKGVKLNDGYELKSKWYQSPINTKDKELYDHPTIKPLELVKKHIEHTTQVDDIVLDTFLGSGTTAVACHETKRQFIGFEIDKSYYDIAQDRINGITQVERKEKELGIQNIFDFIGDKDE